MFNQNVDLINVKIDQMIKKWKTQIWMQKRKILGFLGKSQQIKILKFCG